MNAMNWRAFSTRIRRQESPFFQNLYRLARFFLGLSVPVFKPVHGTLYHLWFFSKDFWHNFWRMVLYEPMFKSQLASVGRGFRLEFAGNGVARIFGNLEVHLGDNVTMYDKTSFIGLKVLDNPKLVVGDNTYLGPALSIYVGKKVTIGSHCLIAAHMITDNPSHSVHDVVRRMQPGGGTVVESEIRPVTIGDFCFLPVETVVYPGVTVGDGVVARIGTHINRDVPPFCQIGGSPFRILKKLPFPQELIAMVGRDRYNAYCAAHEKISLDRQDDGFPERHASP